jgi:hypothetical protein
MPRVGNNRMPVEVKRRYFKLIRSGLSGSDASQHVAVSLSCGSLTLAGWLFHRCADQLAVPQQDDRI